MPERGFSHARRRPTFSLLLAGAVWLLWCPAIAAALSMQNVTPFPSSQLIISARWAGPRYGPPSNQRGDIMPTIWADDGNEYTMIDDGGTDVKVRGALWRQSLAAITGRPPRIKFHHVGDPNSPPPHTFAQINKNRSLWAGPLGPYYSSGLVEAGGVFFATEELNWTWGTNGLFAGLNSIAYSSDHGQTWTNGASAFPAPLGNLDWVVRGKGGVYRDGYVYAIATEREFNASQVVLGRAHPDIAHMTDPARWQWQSGWRGSGAHRWPVWSNSLASAVPIVAWGQHVTYPQMAYDAPLHRYLLTFTYSYDNAEPGVWKNGADLVFLEGPHPWGPFAFVAHEPNFGPSNGYAPGIPVKWISGSGHDLWMKWSANFDGCASGLNCSGGYGFNYRHLHLTLASPNTAHSGGVAPGAASG